MQLVPDATLATITIWQEARGESIEGKIAVAEVIRNRTKAHLFSDGTVAGTVLAPLQFSGWNIHDPNRIPSLKLDTDDPTVQACQHAWDASQTSNLTLGATHYCNLSLCHPVWATPDALTVVIGHQSFYKVPHG